MDKHKWVNLFKILAPLVIATVQPKLIPMTGKIIDAVGEAEHLKDAGSIQDKLAHVKNIASSAADVVNEAKGHVVVDKSSLDASVDNAVSTAVAVVNLVHKQPTQ